METREPALLVLEDGRAFEGLSCGAPKVSVGEVVFNTSMSGYQEILTDPSYAGQLVTLTYPHIGNYGVSDADMESSTLQAAGVIVRSMSEVPSNYRSEFSLPAWLKANGTVAISDIDTRALTRHIRDKGVMMAVIAHGATAADRDHWLDYLSAQPAYGERDFVEEVRVEKPMKVEARAHEHGTVIELGPVEPAQGDQPRVVVLDFGVKHSILRHLCARGFDVTLVPNNLPEEELERLKPDGILVSNGPGDPARLDAALELLRSQATRRPVYGICLGHQLLARAFGGETFKLPFGHRGPNQPVQDLSTRKVQMTSQNHGYAVSPETMPATLEVTHLNLNDGTVEGFRHSELPVHAVQYHPEAGPGPHDAENFFDDFYATVEQTRGRG